VRVGSGCKLEDNALVYQPARLGDGVFIGPGAVLTNDKHPRAVTPSMKPKDGADWAAAGVSVGDGASIGAGAIVLAGVTVGRWAMLGAGTVVTSDVVDYALMAGNPSRRVGWVGPSGLRLTPDGEGTWRCPVTGACFVERDGTLRESP